VITFPRSASLHCWAHFVRQGDITSETSNEDPDTPLSVELTYTYLEPDRKTWARVGRGWWVSHNPMEDELTPEMMFINCLTTNLLPPEAKSDQVSRA
jgi:hypothetical protein